MKRNTTRAHFIGTKLLGRKKPVIETVIDTLENQHLSEQTENSILLMKSIDTETTLARENVIKECLELLNDEPMPLKSNFHIQYLNFAFETLLPSQLTALDASQPWMLYWVANSMKTLNPTALNDEYKRRIVEKLFKISPSRGPFGGGIGQLPHIAGTYAAVNALALCDNIDNCWDQINRKDIYQWLLSLKQKDGGFKTCLEVGENDTRGVYCALSIASQLNILTEELRTGVVEYLINCQTYEGGFGGSPQEDEAHGGYTFCAVASLVILNALDKVDVVAIMNWCSARQENEEMGLNGRSNKLVDGCYSFWVGATSVLLEINGYENCINKRGLRAYILQCCQTEERPGLRDKPGKNSDFYHTNYVLLGLAIAENSFSYTDNKVKSPFSIKSEPLEFTKGQPSISVAINPIYGLPTSDVVKFSKHYSGRSI